MKPYSQNSKILVIVAAILIIGLLLAACGQKTPPWIVNGQFIFEACTAAGKDIGFCQSAYEAWNPEQPAEQGNTPPRLQPTRVLQMETYSETVPQLYSTVHYLKITSLVDKVSIKDMKINRGKCHYRFPVLEYGRKFPVKLGFSEVQKFVVECDRVLEVEADTDLLNGVWQF